MDYQSLQWKSAETQSPKRMVGNWFPHYSDIRFGENDNNGFMYRMMKMPEENLNPDEWNEICMNMQKL